MLNLGKPAMKAFGAVNRLDSRRVNSESMELSDPVGLIGV